jgi:hypothetical protein
VSGVLNGPRDTCPKRVALSLSLMRAPMHGVALQQQDIKKFLDRVEHMAKDSQAKCAEILIDSDVDLETLSTFRAQHGGDEALRQLVRTQK